MRKFKIILGTFLLLFLWQVIKNCSSDNVGDSSQKKQPKSNDTTTEEKISNSWGKGVWGKMKWGP
jgi:hypothetical protein